MHHEIDAAPFFPDHFERRVDGRGIGDVAMPEQQSVKFARQRLDALFQGIALPGQRDFCARRAAGLRNAPGNRAVVGDAEYHPALALHQARMISHSVSSSFLDSPAAGYTSPRSGYT